MSPIAQ
jgi:hypothetical protein